MLQNLSAGLNDVAFVHTHPPLFANGDIGSPFFSTTDIDTLRDNDRLQYSFLVTPNKDVVWIGRNDLSQTNAAIQMMPLIPLRLTGNIFDYVSF